MNRCDFLKKGKRLTFLCLKEKLQEEHFDASIKVTNVPLDRGDRQASRMKMIGPQDMVRFRWLYQHQKSMNFEA